MPINENKAVTEPSEAPEGRARPELKAQQHDGDASLPTTRSVRNLPRLPGADPSRKQHDVDDGWTEQGDDAELPKARCV